MDGLFQGHSVVQSLPSSVTDRADQMKSIIKFPVLGASLLLAMMFYFKHGFSDVSHYERLLFYGPIIEEIFKYVSSFAISKMLKQSDYKIALSISISYGIMESVQYCIHNANNPNVNLLGFIALRLFITTVMHISSSWCNLRVFGLGIILHSTFNAMTVLYSPTVIWWVGIVALVYVPLTICIIIKRKSRSYLR